VLGYTLISHAFDLFLYPDPVFREQLYAAADIDIIWFDALIVLITLVIIFGWFITFLADRNGDRKSRYAQRLWLMFYALTSREFFLPHLYTLMSRRLLGMAQRLNVWLRWI
jgi:NADH-quinone oxidoreductase subunit L